MQKASPIGAGHFYATRANIDVGEQVPVRICHDVAARKQQGALGGTPIRKGGEARNMMRFFFVQV